jgi:hypothetical protein
MTEKNKCVLNIKADGSIDKEIEIGFVGKFSVNQNLPLADALRNTVNDFNLLVNRLMRVSVDDISPSQITPVEIKVNNMILSKHDTDVVLNGHPFTVEPEHPDSFEESENCLSEEPEKSESPVLSRKTLETMSPKKLRNHARNIIVNKILTWNCNNVQDLADIISKEILPIDDALNSSEAFDMLIYITPPSAIDVKSVNAILPKRDPCKPFPPIWAIDKNLNCYFIGDGEIVPLKSELSEK